MRYFGTDGIRGRAGTFPLTPGFLQKLGRASVEFFKDESNVVLLGGDTRESTPGFATEVARGITSGGCNVLDMGIVPTAVLAFFTHQLGAKCGIMVTASHNPWQDNGIKYFKSDGHKLSKDEGEKFEKLIDLEHEPAAVYGKVHQLKDWELAYVEHLKSLFGIELSKLKLVLDLANGAAYELAPLVFTAFGSIPLIINNKPNGENINELCGATNVKHLKQTVKAEQADIGIAFDGDGDRCILIDETGAEVNGDGILAVLADWLKSEGKLSNDTVAATRYSNMGLRASLWQEKQIKVDYAKPGDQYVAELMENCGYALGGENSGHIILRDYETTGNGILTSLKVLEIMVKTGKRLSELNFLKQFPHVLVNVPVSEKPPLKSLPAVQAAIGKVERTLGDKGRVFVRYSGTQKLVRIMIEGEPEDLIKECANQIAEAFR